MGLVLFPHNKMKEDWYFYDEKEHKYKLTDKCPEEGKKVYQEYLDQKKRIADALKGIDPRTGKKYKRE